MPDEKYIALLDEYLDGNLNEEESKTLLAQVASNPELKELLGILTIARESIRQSGYMQTIEKIHQEFENDQITPNREAKEVKFKPQRWWIGIAASLTILFFAGNYWIQNLADNLYQEKYIAYEIPTMRSSGLEEEKLEEEFKNKNWDLVTKSVTIQDRNRKNLFLTGVSYFEIGDYSNSQKYLNQLQLMNASELDNLFEDETDYYLFLNYLKTENYRDAKSLMEKITSDSSHVYYGSFDAIDRIKLQALQLFKP